MVWHGMNGWVGWNVEYLSNAYRKAGSAELAERAKVAKGR